MQRQEPEQLIKQHHSIRRIAMFKQVSYTTIRYWLKRWELKSEGCGIIDWMGHLAPLELDHKDGDSANNELDNLRLICPNCHAQTENYKGRNKGRGRYSRRERYAQGKGD